MCLRRLGEPVFAQHAVQQAEGVPNCNMNVVLVNPYELGRQPFGLAEPAAWLKNAGSASADCSIYLTDSVNLSREFSE